MSAGISGLLLAAGQGTRLGRPKALLEAGGRTLLARVVGQMRPHCAELLVGVPAELADRAAALLADPAVRVVAGGGTRRDTVGRLAALATREIVLVHEVARPFAPPALFAAVAAAAAADGAASPALPAGSRDGLGLREGAYLVAPLARDRVVALQTPQAYRRALLAELLRRAAEEDWAEQSLPNLAARAGLRVRLIDGSPGNVKVTFLEDWAAAADRLRELSE